MKKIIITTISLLGILIQSNTAYAKSGACSWHGGVNCSYGRDYDGSVICNDGWKDSSTLYEFTKKCQEDSGQSYFSYWLLYQDMLKGVCQGTGYSWILSMDDVNKHSLYYNPEEPGGFDTFKCIDDQEAQTEKYGFSNSWSNHLVYCSQLHVDEQNYIAVKKAYEERKALCEQASNVNWCTGKTNTYLGSDNKCYCKDGYQWDLDTKECVEFDPCPFPNSYHNDEYCYCNTGYQWNNDKTVCNKIPTTTKGTATTQTNNTPQIPQRTQMFTDIDDSPNFDAILYLYSQNIISGYEDKTFRPNNSVNRAELIKILVEAKFSTPSSDLYKNCFTDVGTEWYARYVCFAKSKKWVDGYPNGTFKPEQTVKKAEAIKILLNSQNIEIPASITSDPFNDIQTKDWFAPYIYKAKQLGILEETGSTFSPGEGMSRGGISENLYRLIK